MLSQRANSAKLLSRAKQMRKAPSDAEQKLWLALRNRQLEGLKFRRQLPIDGFIADFACDACKIIVEVDGDQHADAEGYDAARTEKLGLVGWRVVRFSARDVVRDLDAVLASILQLARPSPYPLPAIPGEGIF